MAEIPGGGKLLDIFGGNERIPTVSFFGYLFSGIAVDVLAFWLPGAGDVFIVVCRGMYWLNSYKTDGMATATFADMVVEAIPVVEALPGATTFVIWTYLINRAETTKVAESLAGRLATAKALQMRNNFIAQRGIAQALGNEAGPQTTPHPGEKSAGRSLAYQENSHGGGGGQRSVDGTRSKSAYDVLGVGSTASQKDISTAYRNLAQKYHPDAVGGGDAEKMKSINAAYDNVKTADNRSRYDSKTSSPSTPPQRPNENANTGYGARPSNTQRGRIFSGRFRGGNSQDNDTEYREAA